jgi:Putative beta-barrel porin-2, OmpL-like. bbp2
MGNEVIETKDNWNYGRSLLFTLAVPYYHMAPG